MSGDAFHDALSEVCPPMVSRLAFLTAAHSDHADQFFARTRRPRLDKPFEPDELAELLVHLFPTLFSRPGRDRRPGRRFCLAGLLRLCGPPPRGWGRVYGS